MKRTLVTVWLVTLSLLSHTSWAAERLQLKEGFFVSAASGAAGIDLGSIGNADVGGGDHSGFVGKVSAGYWFAPNWGIAVDYLELGDFEQEFVTGNFRGSANSYGASLLGRLPLGDHWSIVGKLSLSQTKMKDDGSTGANFDQFFGDDFSVVLPGLEVNYHFNQDLAAYFEVEGRGQATDKLDLGFVGIGLRYTF